MKRRSQSLQCLSTVILILMLVTLFISVVILKATITSTIFISIVFIVFAILIKESSANIWTSKLKLSLAFARLEVERDKEKTPNELRHYCHSKQRPQRDLTEVLYTRARTLFDGKQFSEAAELYRVVFEVEQPAFWAARVNELYARVLAGQYEAALAIAQSIKDTCKEKKFLAQTLVNEGDLLMIMSEKFSNNEFEAKAYLNYRDAHQTDPDAIGPMFHYWLAEKVAGHNDNAERIARRIKEHKDYSTLGPEDVEYLERFSKMVNQREEDFIMIWKRLLVSSRPVIGMFAFFAICCTVGVGILNTAP